MLFFLVSSSMLRMLKSVPKNLQNSTEEECSFFLPLGTFDLIELLLQSQSIFCHEYVQFCRWASSGMSSRFALTCVLLAEASTFDFKPNSSNFISEVSCSLSSCSLLFKSVVQTMRHSDRRVKSVFVYRSSSNVHSRFTLQVTGCDFQYGSNFGIPSKPTSRVT